MYLIMCCNREKFEFCHKWIIFLLVVIIFNVTFVSGKTQSNVHDDCPTCSGALCPSGLVEFEATETPQTLTSPNYPQNYPNNELCRWILTAPYEFQAVRVSIKELHIRSNSICKEDYLLLQDGGWVYSPQLRTCCLERCKDIASFTSSGNEMRVTFKSDVAHNDVGFNMTYWSVHKATKEDGDVVYGLVNYVLYAIFIVVALTASCVTICSVIKHNGFCHNMYSFRSRPAHKERIPPPLYTDHLNGSVKHKEHP